MSDVKLPDIQNNSMYSNGGSRAVDQTKYSASPEDAYSTAKSQPAARSQSFPRQANDRSFMGAKR